MEIRQLTYLQKVLQRKDGHWTRVTLNILEEKNVGWAKQINQTLDRWGLETEWKLIAKKSSGQWRKEVKDAAEKMNLERLKEECQSKNRGETKQKTKTASLEKVLSHEMYERAPHPFIFRNQTMIFTRALIMGRYGMLQCANNFSNKYGSKECKQCSQIDDETHRINHCPKWSRINQSESDDEVVFNNIYSDDYEKCLEVVKRIVSMWDLANGRNEMREGL